MLRQKKFYDCTRGSFINVECCWHCASDPQIEWENSRAQYLIEKAPIVLRSGILSIPGSSQTVLTCTTHSNFVLLHCFLELPRYAVPVATPDSLDAYICPFAVYFNQNGTFASTIQPFATFSHFGLFLSNPCYPLSQEKFRVQRKESFTTIELRLIPTAWKKS